MINLEAAERLKELLEEAVDRWAQYAVDCKADEMEPEVDYYQFLANHLMMNGVIELPCKVGDVVYFLPDVKLYNATLISIEINCYTTPQIWLTIEYDSQFSANNTYKSRIDLMLGKTLFLTKAEAEAALMKLKEV